MTKRYDEDKVYNALVSMFYYNYDEALIDDLLKVVKEKSNTKDDHVSFSDVDDFWQDNEGAQFIWGMLVLMFGDYGVSPRVGWLNTTKDLISFLEDMQEDLKLDA